MVSERVEKAGESQSNHFTISLEAGRSKLVLSVTQTQFSYSIKVVQICPDVTEVGSTLEESKFLRHEHDELILKFNAKRNEALSTLGKANEELKKQAENAWEGVYKQLETRKSLLDQSVSFHISVQQFLKKLQLVESKCVDVPLSHDVEGAKRDLQKHQELKKTILEASMMTLQEGQLLLDKIRKAALQCGSHNRHATTSGCYAIEQQLINLRYRQIRLDELWLQRKIQLEQCIRFFMLKEDVSKVVKWFEETGESYLNKKNLGSSLEDVFRSQEEFSHIEDQFAPHPQKLKYLLWSLGYIVNDNSLTSNIDALRDVIQNVEAKCDSFSSSLDTRKRNLSLASNFFSHAQDSSARLDGLEVLAGSLEHSTLGVEESYIRLLHGVYDATATTIHEGTVLLNRVGRDEPAAASINAKLTTIQDRANKLTSRVPSSIDAGKLNDACFQLEEKLYKLNSWYNLVAQTTINRFNRLTVSLSDVNEFLVVHRALAEEVRAKQAEARQFISSAEELTKGDKKGEVLVGKAKKLDGDLEKLKESLEKRSKLALAFVVLQKRERQLSAQLQLMEDELRSGSGDEVTEQVFRLRENSVKKLHSDVSEFQKNGQQFILDLHELKMTDSLSVEFVLNAVSLILSNFVERQTIVSSLFEGWKTFVGAGKEFKNQWKQLLMDVKKTIEWIIKVEDNFFPKLAGELGSSLTEVQHHQKRLEDFKHIVKKVHEETEKHLRSAELLSIKGDSNGHKDFIINELIKTHTRFQARICEYKHLLSVATHFFENLKQLDSLIEATEREYTGDNLPVELHSAKQALENHEVNRNKLTNLIDASSYEADDIIVRVRQQDAQEVAKDEVRKVLQLSEQERRGWEKAWEDHKKKLEQGLQLCQFYFDLKQLQNELDLLQRQLEARQGSFGNSPASVQAIIQAFQQLQDLADAVGVRVSDFMGTADRMIKDGHYDSRKIRHEVDETHKRWKNFYDTLSRYKLSLEGSMQFYHLHNQSEGWINDAGQFLLGISKQAPNCKIPADVEKLVQQIIEYRKDGGMKQDGRLNEMELIATKLYGSVAGPEKMQNILDKNHDMYNAFVKAIEELRILQKNLVSTEHILAKVDAVVEMKAPRQPKFVQPLQNVEIAEGQRFTFECRVECGTVNPVVEWFRENEPTKGFVASYKDGLCQLVIEETLLADSAQYTCKATTEAGSAQTTARLRVKEAQARVVAPELLKHLRSADAPEGTSHTFECHVTGIPFPTITWYRNDEEIITGPDYMISSDQGHCILKIKRLNKDIHSAKFKFKASNPGGEVVTSASLNVLTVHKPEFPKPLKDEAVEEGKGVRLECSYTGHPAPQIQWTFNDSPLLPSALFKIIIGDSFTVLEIKEVFVEDCGTYGVSARNIGGEAHTSCLVALVTSQTSSQLQFSRTPEKPRFVVPLQDKEDEEGNRVRFDCVVIGYPTPELSWYHNGKSIKQTKDFDFTHDASTGKSSLIIHELYLEDKGVYLCKAHNEHGSDTTFAKLHVEPLKDQVDGRAGPDEVPPKFTQLLKDIEGTEGELVRFECRVIGHPSPVIKWYCGRNQIENSSEFQITSERELQILTIPVLHKHDAGNYMVKATNNAGIAKCYATLMVKHKTESHGMKMRLVESSHSVQTDVPVQAGHVPPDIVKSFHDIHVRPGQPCTMEVVISGFPKPKIQWLFNNESITSEKYKISTFGDVHSLHIPHVFDEDVGRFSVIAENDAGKAWCSALLVVVDTSQLVGDAESPPETPLTGQRSATLDYRPVPVVQIPVVPQCTFPMKPAFLADLPPKFFAGLRDMTSETGKRLVLEVLVEGRPEPLVTWYRGGVELSASPDFEISCVDGRARLVVLSPKISDSGEYVCIARNNLGQSRSSARITIKAPGIPPRFTEQLQPSTTCKEGQPVRFVIITSGDPPPTVTWYREGVEIMPSPDFVVTSEGNKHTLLIPEAYPEDSGRFTAKVSSPYGEITTSTLLTVQAAAPVHLTAPKFTKPLHNKTVRINERVILQCALPVETRPERVKWFHNEVELFVSSQYNISYKPDQGLCTLIIEGVQPESRGRYVCTVYIDGSARSTAMDLEVILPIKEKVEKPHFTDHLRNTLADEGSDVVLVCQVKGHPRPTIQWYHNGHLVHPSSKHEIKVSPTDWSYSLIIIGITIHDAGIYTCCASNEHGQEYTSAEVKFRPKGRSPMPQVHTERIETETFKSREIGGVTEQYFRPIFKKMPADLHVPEGHVARFDCVVVGRPIPDVYWFREGVRVLEDRMHKIVINEEGISSIIFESVIPADAGVYLCIARNRAGEDRFTVSLNVLPYKSLAPPRFSARLPNQTVIVGQPVTFTVDVEGIPIPKITWHKDEQLLMNSDKYHISSDGYRSTLYISFVTLDDNAWFQCVASSSSGTTANKFRLIVEDDQGRVISRKSLSPGVGQRSASGHLPSPSPVQSTHIFSPTQQLVHSKRTVSETTLKSQTTHAGAFKNQTESVPAPKLVEPLKDQLLMVGGTAHFRCRIHSLATPTTHEWFFNDRPLQRNSWKYRMFEGFDGLYGLDIEDAGEGDAGIYKCAVHNKGGEVTCIAHLRVGAQPSAKVTTRVHATPSPIPFIQVPHIVRPITDVSAEPGGSATFEVVFSGPPMSQITWLVNGQKVTDGENVQISQTSNSTNLRIKHVDPSMTGKVQCLASNSNGNVESTAYLHITSGSRNESVSSFSVDQHGISRSPFGHGSLAPCMTKHLDNVLARDGSEVVLPCSFKGELPLKVSWFHNGRNIDHSQDFAITVDEAAGYSKLVILDCMMDDGGTFKCVVQNRHGSDQAECQLKVSPPQQAYQNFSTVFSVQDDSLKSGGSELKRSRGDFDRVDQVSASSTSANVSEEILVPQYTQKYYEKSESFRFDAAKSSILHDPNVPKGAPNFIQPIEPCVVVEGETCSFVATVEADPAPSIEWFKDKQPLFPSSRHVIKSDPGNKKYALDLLGCSQLFDAGVYSCCASNVRGKATCTANVVVVSK